MKPLVDSVQFFNSAILAKFNIVSLRRRSVDYPPTLHCAQNAIDLVKCCTNEISCAHRLQNIRGNIGLSSSKKKKPGMYYNLSLHTGSPSLYLMNLEPVV